MKKILLLIISTAIIFTVLTYSTASLQRQVDGSDRYGFPASFYVIHSEMVYPTPVEQMTNFIVLNLAFDIAVAFLIAIIILGIYKKTKKRFVRNI